MDNWCEFLQIKNKKAFLAKNEIDAKIMLGKYRDGFTIYTTSEQLLKFCCPSALVAKVAEIFQVDESRIFPALRVKCSNEKTVSVWKTCMSCDCSAAKRMSGRK